MNYGVQCMHSNAHKIHVNTFQWDICLLFSLAAYTNQKW